MSRAKREMPVFVKIEDYKDVIDIIELIKNKVTDANKVLANIKNLKVKEDNELAEWNAKLENVEEKIEEIDRTLFEPENI